MHGEFRSTVWILATACLVISCGDGTGKSGDPDSGEMQDAGPYVAPDARKDNPPIRDLVSIPNPSNALSWYVEWSTDAPALTELEVVCGEDWSQTYEASEKRTEHRVFVAGLWEGATCTATARADVHDTEPVEASTEFKAGPLPDFLPDFELVERKPDQLEPGWTLFNLWNKFDDVPLTVALVDSRGRYRWYHQLSTSNPGSDTDVRTFRKGVLVGGDRGHVGAHYLNWQGDTLWRGDFPMHHEIQPVAGGDEFYYLTMGEKCPDDQSHAHAIVHYDWNQENELGRWNFCEFFVPEDPKPDWSHLNAIEPFPKGSSLLISSRTQHTLFKIDPEAEEGEWMMGIKGDFGISGEDRFFRQHAPEIQPNGNIVLFDNGSLARGEFTRTWSRAIEISYDTEIMEAGVVWSYRPDPDLFAPIWGDADRLENGNTLVTFGIRNQNPDKNSRIVEVTEQGTEVWRLDAPNKWGWYRSERFDERPTGWVLGD
jgi:hypothetical protein